MQQRYSARAAFGSDHLWPIRIGAPSGRLKRYHSLVDLLSHHIVDGIVVGSFMTIAAILLWPMTMDRRQRWRNKRVARKFEAAERGRDAQRRG